MLKPFEVKAGHDGQLLHGQLLGGLLVTMATTALDLSAAAKVLWSGEPAQAVCERCGSSGVTLSVKC